MPIDPPAEPRPLPDRPNLRHLKGQGKAPKYGLLFAHPAVQQAKEKGKAARLVAAKLSLAARVDFYRKSLEPTLKAELERKLKGVLLRSIPVV